jgi:sugar/nucleoside kinase (ribokinase family)
VALNVGLALRGHGLRPALLSAVGRDAEGTALIAECEEAGLDCRFLTRPDALPTDHYMVIEAAGQVLGALADAHTLEVTGGGILAPLRDGRLGDEVAPWRGPVVLDGNLTVVLLREIVCDPCFAHADLSVAPASPGKADRLKPLTPHPGLTLYVNRIEAGLLLARDFEDAPMAAAALRDSGVARVLVTDGAAPAAYHGPDGALSGWPPPVQVAQVTGAGDVFMAAHIAAELGGADACAALERALEAAARHVSGGTFP